MPQYVEKAEKLTLPVVPLNDAVAFPNIPIDFESEDAAAVAALESAEATGMLVLLVCTKTPTEDSPAPSDLYSVGTVARIRQSTKGGADKAPSVRFICECRQRATVKEYYKTGDLITASVMAKTVELPDGGGIRGEAYAREIRAALDRMTEYLQSVTGAIRLAVKSIEDISLLSDFVASAVLVRTADKQAVLEEFDPYLRSALLIKLINSECILLECEQDIQQRTRGNIARNQREYYLREQLKVIEDELGEDDDPDDFTSKIKEAKLPEEIEEKLLKENDRLSKTPFGSAEATVLRTYIETVLEIPWNESTRDRVSVSAAKKILDDDHYGLFKVKERILEFLAVKQLNPSLRNQIICLVGPPGTGKTSIAESIARSMNRKYVRVSLGGVRDESDIRGHRKTYVASMPGRIINALIQAKVKNPLILLDEIDKLSSDSRGDPSSAMLEVLDPEQNKTFRDHFVELPFDLSDCLFITTANTLDTIPRPLIDRMEVIELSSYTRREKLEIAKRHLVPKQLKRHGMSRRTVKISDEAIYELIDCYTREAGVRNLERTVAQLCRKAARRIIESDGRIKTVKIDRADVESFLGGRKLLPEKIGDGDLVGVVNGLAYTEMGGDMLKVEVAVLDGTGKLELTGSLGDVMKESARAALTFVRSIAAEYGIPSDFYKTRDIHIHVPEGAVPKDGPSAGVTMTCALVSALSGIPVRQDVAMTGEVTLTGRVLAIGGLREKTMAAYAAGVTTVLIPDENLSNLDEVDSEVKEKLTFIPCKHARDVLAVALAKGGSTTQRTVNDKTETIFIPQKPLNAPVIRGKDNKR